MLLVYWLFDKKKLTNYRRNKMFGKLVSAACSCVVLTVCIAGGILLAKEADKQIEEYKKGNS
jgi:hypothetical protein